MISPPVSSVTQNKNLLTVGHAISIVSVHYRVSRLTDQLTPRRLVFIFYSHALSQNLGWRKSLIKMSLRLEDFSSFIKLIHFSQKIKLMTSLASLILFLILKIISFRSASKNTSNVNQTVWWKPDCVGWACKLITVEVGIPGTWIEKWPFTWW